MKAPVFTVPREHIGWAKRRSPGRVAVYWLPTRDAFEVVEERPTASGEWERASYFNKRLPLSAVIGFSINGMALTPFSVEEVQRLAVAIDQHLESTSPGRMS